MCGGGCMSIPHSSFLCLMAFAARQRTSLLVALSHVWRRLMTTVAWTAGPVVHHRTSFSKEETDAPLALVVANRPIPFNLLHCLWDRASLRVCADGGSNRLFDIFHGTEFDQMTPDFLHGDMDSARPEVVRAFESRGARVIRDCDVNTTDLDKCIRLVLNQPVPAPGHGWTILVAGAFGGRMDHVMANLHTLYVYPHHHLVLFSDDEIAFLLTPGTHVIHGTRPSHGNEKTICGLVPLGQECRYVRTEGLRWDLDGSRPLRLGTFISTSNEVLAEEVTVNVSHPVIWLQGIRLGV